MLREYFCGRMRIGNRGFTLVEMMVVVSLLALFCVIIAKVFGTGTWLAHYRLKSAARDLASNMQRARMQAIKENRDWAIVFTTGSNASYDVCWNSGADGLWQTLGDNDCDSRRWVFADYKSGVTLGIGAAPAGVESEAVPADGISFVSDMVVFDGRGTLDSALSGAGGYCYLTNEQGSAYAVGARLTGIVRLKVWDGGAWK